MARGKKTQTNRRRGSRPLLVNNFRKVSSVNNTLLSSRTPAGSWKALTIRLIVEVGGSAGFTNVRFNTYPILVTQLALAGEYRYKSVVAIWDPLTADPTVGTIAVHPYFDNLNAGTSLAEILAAGGRSKPAHQPFRSSLSYTTDPQDGTVVEGGLTIFWATGKTVVAANRVGWFTVYLTLEQRGLKPTSTIVDPAGFY